MITNNSPYTDNHLIYGLPPEKLASINQAIDENQQTAKILLLSLHHADLADFISDSSLEKKRLIVEILGEDFTPEILVELNPTVRSIIINMLHSEQLKIVGSLGVDDIIYILTNIAEDKKRDILQALPSEKYFLVKEGLSYPDNSAGRIMHKQFVAVPEYWTIHQTIEYLKLTPELPFHFYEVFVTNVKGKPIGSLLVSHILRSDHSLKTKDVMEKDLKILNVTLDQEEVCYLFKQYGLVSAPVINRDNQLVGVILIDDIVNLIEEEAEEDIMRIVGVKETDFHSAFFHIVKDRFPWLFISLITCCMASLVISLFNDTIHNIVNLAAIMPIVASMGGNAGTQTLAVVVRAIAHRELSMSNARRTVLKEICASILNGVALALLGSVIILLFFNDIHLGLIFAGAVIINFTLASFFGSVTPLVLARMGADPAIASSVFLIAITDIIGFLAFLGLAHKFLL
jgi:magnesium transporter